MHRQGHAQRPFLVPVIVHGRARNCITARKKQRDAKYDNNDSYVSAQYVTQRMRTVCISRRTEIA